ncbi:MAG: TonB-dependent receptor [Tenacibaculum sp.]
MRKFKNVLLVALFFVTATVLGQTKLTGVVVDEMGEPLPGASVLVKGTTNGTATDFDGKFMLNAKSNSGAVVISFVGYNNLEKAFSAASTNLGTIELAPSNILNEIVVTATSLAIDRKTPVAVSTVKAADIERKLGNQEFPEVLKSTPGVYATKQGGGFGDSRITMRGFNSENVAVMINGVPVNDMENGRVFWSNWAGLGDVTSVMQTQRGLGASKVAVPSIGGTINIVTKSTDSKKGGNIIASTGNDGYQKYGFTLSTGKMDNGFAATVSLAEISGNGFVDGTEFEGWNYFANLAYEINDSHTLSFTTFGAPQRHGQRQNRSSIDTYRKAESGIRFNPDWGLRGGKVVHVEDNFYHKNQTSLNHYWNISDITNVSTALYFSVGRGGGGGTAGNSDLFDVRLGGFDQPIDIDNIVAINRARGAQGAESALRASKNEHNWYGALSTLKTEINEGLDFLVGLDYRHYEGLHYQELTDLLGGQYFLDNNDVNNPNRATKVGDKIAYNNDGIVDWFGGFVQVEYSNDNFNAFVSSSVSNTSYQRIDYFNYLDSDPLQKTDVYDFVGFGTKGGVNYKINQTHNVFANVGYFEKAPLFRNVFTAFDNEIENINVNAENEKITSFELGYGLRSEKLSFNLNGYYTKWDDKSESVQVDDRINGEQVFVNITGVNAIHMGVELDFVWKPIDELKFTGMASVGDWRWNTNIINQEAFNQQQESLGFINAVIDDVKVGDSAQTTAALGVLYKFWEKSSLTIDYNYFANLYADFDTTSDVSETEVPVNEISVITDAWKMPDYHTVDASLRHGFKFGSFDTTLTLRVNNVLDTEYISDAVNGSGSNAANAQVWYGAGRTFSLGAKIKF